MKPELPTMFSTSGQEAALFHHTPVHRGKTILSLNTSPSASSSDKIISYLVGWKSFAFSEAPLELSLETASTCPTLKLLVFSQFRIPTYLQFKSSLSSTAVPKMLGRYIFDSFILSPYLLLSRRLGIPISLGVGNRKQDLNLAGVSSEWFPPCGSFSSENHQSKLKIFTSHFPLLAITDRFKTQYVILWWFQHATV